ncbi:hypothetical protein FQN57_003224 [Myotisia sp. PD_48]|nr:hypothetical protein FQN57_003224 [Myotisia sp. PD_48]
MISVSNTRAESLAREAVELVDAGHKEAASRNIREAIAIAPDNEDVKSAFRKIRDDEETNHPLLNLCQRFVTKKDEDAGRETSKYLRADGLQPPADVALECLKLLLSYPASNLPVIQDDIITGLVRQSAHVRRYFAAEIQKSVTEFFDRIYERGDGAVVCLDMVVLEKGLWQSEKTRAHCERELFLLFIAKLMESGHDYDGRSLKGIARLLAVDAVSLQHLVDEDSFDVIVSCLDRRLPADVRNQATLATAKYLEAANETGQSLCSKFVMARMAKRKHEDYIIALSAASVVFPIMPEFAASLFLTEGFLPSLTPLLDRKSPSNNLALTVLDLFNSACVNSACREAIAKHHSGWLAHKLTNGSEETSALAAVVLAKIRTSEKIPSASKDNNNAPAIIEASTSASELVERFKNGLARTNEDQNLPHLVEGLAYSSTKADIKEQLSKDSKFLRDLIGVLLKNVGSSAVLYGGLMIICNITTYPPTLSDEQKKISELKAYANASKPSAEINELDDNEHVKTRCNTVVDAGVMPLLVECGKTHFTSTRDLIAKILLSLSKDSKQRGKLAQQGAVRLLISLLTTQENGTARKSDESIHNSAHALARILISVNPAHIFPSSGFPQITSAIRPLALLLNPSSESNFMSDQPRDFLPVFESLLALTNLASYPDPDVRTAIIRATWPTVEDLLLSPHTYIQRAACELVCNLMVCEAGIGKFADGTQRAGQRLHILLALADVEDLPTRRAAGGALAVLTEFDGAVAAILDRARGVEILLGLCADPDDGIVHRGIVCVHNLVCATGNIGQRARGTLLEKGALNSLRECATKGSNPVVIQIAIESLKQLATPQNGT